jgi:hypothetical protein
MSKQTETTLEEFIEVYEKSQKALCTAWEIPWEIVAARYDIKKLATVFYQQMRSLQRQALMKPIFEEWCDNNKILERP